MFIRASLQLRAKEGGKGLAVKVGTDHAKAADDAGSTLTHVGLARNIVEVEPSALALHDALGTQNGAVNGVGQCGERGMKPLHGVSFRGFCTVADEHLVGVVMVVTVVVMIVVMIVTAACAMLVVLVMMLVLVLIMVMMVLIVMMLVMIVVVMVIVIAITAAALAVLAMLVMMLVLVLIVMMMLVMMVMMRVRKLLLGGFERVAVLDGVAQLLARKGVPIGGHDHGVRVLRAAKRHAYVARRYARRWE